MKAYQELHAAHMALANCKKSGNDVWAEKWEARIAKIMEFAPSGSGFDSGTQIFEIMPTAMKFQTSFHHMDGNGSYDGWTEHTVTVRPGFNGIGISVGGKNKNQIKEYIGDVFHEWLMLNVSKIGEDFIIGTMEQAA